MNEFMAPSTKKGSQGRDTSQIESQLKDTRRFTLSLYAGDVQLSMQLSRIESWDFDVFKIAELTNGHPLFTVAYDIFTKFQFASKFKFSDSKLKSLLREVEDGYHTSNPYHNNIHAADVTQAVFYFIATCGLSKYLSDLEIFAVLLASILHDYDHPGTNNTFHVKKGTTKAILYNDNSVLENHHLTQGWLLLTKDANNILSSLSPEDYVELRENVIKTVLATDMTHHFESLGRFKTKVAGAGVNANSREDRMMLMQMCVKAADISSATRPLKLAQEWALRVMAEFFNQGDLERESGLPISPFMDRTNTSIPKCQTGFIDYIVTPLYDAWSTFLPEVKPCCSSLKETRAFWERAEKEKMPFNLPKPPSLPSSSSPLASSSASSLLSPLTGPSSLSSSLSSSISSPSAVAAASPSSSSSSSSPVTTPMTSALSVAISASSSLPSTMSSRKKK
eukprot:TRINITY_DN2689_c0_g2_i1.p1 TRINITY_DN2689_c0_g2~~TRINITY_DN2689_c0_g2_i1.p1  ORF type:complete len:450 (+),score=98.09 TRINITY_DN2689_c0_g2_i1:655-2004(+)